MNRRLAQLLAVVLVLPTIAGVGAASAIHNTDSVDVTDSAVVPEGDGYAALVEVTTTTEPSLYGPGSDGMPDHVRWVGIGHYETRDAAQQATDDYEPNNVSSSRWGRILAYQTPFAGAGAVLFWRLSKNSADE